MSSRRSRRGILRALGTTAAAGFAGCVNLLGHHRGEIPIGALLPRSGALSDYGPGMERAVRMAVRDVNEAGGPLDRDLALHAADTATKLETAEARYSEVVEEHGVVALVGPVARDVVAGMAGPVADDGVMLVTNASTDPRLATRGYATLDGSRVKLLGRTAPNATQQGVTMGYVMNEHVGADTAAFLARNEPERLVAEAASRAFEGRTLRVIEYDLFPEREDLDRLFRDQPDAIGYVDYSKPARGLLRKWHDSEYGGRWVLAESVAQPSLLSAMPDVVEGMYTVAPRPEPTEGRTRFTRRFDGDPPVFAPHAYDAAFLITLAVQRAGAATAADVANHLQAVSRSPGRRVTVGEFDEATSALADGGPVDYEGASSRLELTSRLEPRYPQAVMQIRDGQRHELEVRPRSHGTLYPEG